MIDGDADTTRLLALLRSVNVGRAKRVDMAQLRDQMLDLGSTDVRTHLQSGNAIFSFRTSAVATAVTNIERALARELRVASQVVVRIAADLAAAMTPDPLLEPATDPKKHLAGFLAADPDPGVIQELEARDFGLDRIRVVGRQAHLWCAAGVLASPLSRVDWDKTLGGVVTKRDRDTVTEWAPLLDA